MQLNRELNFSDENLTKKYQEAVDIVYNPCYVSADRSCPFGASKFSVTKEQDELSFMALAPLI